MDYDVHRQLGMSGRVPGELEVFCGEKRNQIQSKQDRIYHE